ncbi:hypothetical protein OC842_006827 [Tilletia horrida]|uniref:Uncharacterized protein n=1 Tax=Tilletia horrida TaxID=155126 RepID=A0AAN6JH92_9BASI|nr:hypothetical protein OC842_006827 [Tilletia horrida]
MDEEELDAFDGLGDVPTHNAFERLVEALRAYSGMVRSSSQNTAESTTTDVPELAAPKEALDLQVESLTLPVLVSTGAGASGGSLKAPSSITPSRTASITFVPKPMLSESSHESAPRTAKVARLQHQHHGHAQQGRRSPRSISGFHIGNWGRKDTEMLNLAGPEMMGLAILPSQPPPSRSSSSSSSSLAATRLFNSIARRSKTSLKNLSQTFEACVTSTERVVLRASMKLRRSSMSDELGRGNGNAGAESASLLLHLPQCPPPPPLRQRPQQTRTVCLLRPSSTPATTIWTTHRARLQHRQQPDPPYRRSEGNYAALPSTPVPAQPGTHHSE